ncbi:MAG: hypothetical protein ACFFHV_21115, partial [Promethearchaeota archaeon]
FSWLRMEDYYYKANTLEEINSLDLFGKGLLFFICLASLISTLLFTFGIYLIFFNKRVLRTEYKPYSFFIVGLIFGVIFGFAPGFWLLS